MFLQRLLNSKNQVHKAMDTASLRQEAIAQNIANIDTPGYRRKTVSFEENLNNASKRLAGAQTHQRHLPINAENQIRPKIVEVSEGSARADGNGVVIEGEMAREAQNAFLYQALAQRAGFDTARKAINGK